MSIKSSETQAAGRFQTFTQAGVIQPTAPLLFLLVWIGAFCFAHDWMYRLHTRWFRLPVQTYDAIHYAGMAIYKIGIILLYLVPWIVLLAYFPAAVGTGI